MIRNFADKETEKVYKQVFSKKLPQSIQRVALRKLIIKTQAEAILTQLGLPRSVAIDAFYRQIIIHRGLPFSLTIPESKLPAYDDMNVAEFNQMMTTGLAQAKADDSFDMDEVFEELESGLEG